MSSINNTNLGTDSLDDNNGEWNTALGAYSMSGNNSGGENVAIGGNTLLLNNSGSYNTAVGTAA